MDSNSSRMEHSFNENIRSLSARLHGHITDVNGALIPGAQVSLLIADSTTVLARTISSDEGRYEFTSLEPGIYDLEVSATVFKRAIYKNIKVDAGDDVETMIQLSVAEEIELVGVVAFEEVPSNVTAHEPAIDLKIQKRSVPPPPKLSKSKKP